MRLRMPARTPSRPTEEKVLILGADFGLTDRVGRVRISCGTESNGLQPLLAARNSKQTKLAPIRYSVYWAPTRGNPCFLANCSLSHGIRKNLVRYHPTNRVRFNIHTACTQVFRLNSLPPMAVDLFSGCGGLSLGLRQAGFNVVGAIELDRNAAETYVGNHPDVELWEDDIRNVEPSTVLGSLAIQPGELDLLAGCPPCQGFSSLRTLNGSVEIDDAKNALLFELLRFAASLQPKAVLMENVPSLACSGEFREFDGRMNKCGYLGNYRILDAADFGVPQRRRRMIYVAGKGERLRIVDTSKTRKTVRDAIANLPQSGCSGDLIHDLPEKRSKRIVRLISQIPKNGGSRTDLPEESQLDCHKRCDGFHDVYGRMAWDKVSPTITDGLL